MKQVYLHTFGIWSNVLDECDTFLVAKDADGINDYVIKDGNEIVRVVE